MPIAEGGRGARIHIAELLGSTMPPHRLGAGGSATFSDIRPMPHGVVCSHSGSQMARAFYSIARYSRGEASNPTGLISCASPRR